MIQRIFWLALVCAVVSTGSLEPSRAFAEEPILSLSERIGMLEVQDEAPLVQVFASGEVLVHRPSHWINPGDFRTTLSPAELETLVVDLLDLDLGSVDAAAIQAAKAQSRRRAGDHYEIHVSDPNEITLTVNVSGSAGRAAVRKEIRHLGLRADAVTYPEIDEVQAMLAATNRLRELASSRNLRAAK